MSVFSWAAVIWSEWGFGPMIGVVFLCVNLIIWYMGCKVMMDFDLPLDTGIDFDDIKFKDVDLKDLLVTVVIPLLCALLGAYVGYSFGGIGQGILAAIISVIFLSPFLIGLAMVLVVFIVTGPGLILLAITSLGISIWLLWGVRL